MIVRPEIRRIGSVKNQFGEGPLWDVAEYTAEARPA